MLSGSGAVVDEQHSSAACKIGIFHPPESCVLPYAHGAKARAPVAPVSKAMFLPRLILVLICSFVAFMTSHSAKCPHIWPPKRTPQYPFGKREANETVQQVDEATIEVHVPGTGFRFYESNFNSVFVSVVSECT